MSRKLCHAKAMKKNDCKSENFESFKRKRVGGFIVEMITYKNAGAEITVWSKGYEKLEYIWPPSDDKQYHKTDTVNFWEQENAIPRYKDLKTSKDVIALLKENM